MSIDETSVVEERQPQRLTRTKAAEFLSRHGFPISATYFRLLCSQGFGPPVDTWFGKRALYVEADLLAWARSRGRIALNAAAA